jgi:RNA polymerase sigma-70 factor (ECF subfamily)
MEIDKKTKQFLDAYDAFGDDLYRHCLFRLSDHEKAKDLVQETFTKTWEYLAKGKTVDDIRPFLYRVLHNLIVDHLRQKKPVSSLDQKMSDEGFDIRGSDRDVEENKIDARLLMTMLDEIDESYREMLVMRYVDDLSIKEIAKLTGEHDNAISVRIHRALKKLKELYESRNE